MGHKVRVLCVSALWRFLTHPQQWYKRRKSDANCYVGHKFEDPREHEENCPCEDDDYEWYGATLDYCSRNSRFGSTATTTTSEAAISVFQLVLNQSQRTFVRETIPMKRILDPLDTG